MITIVSHDAGGAEIISEWLKKKNKKFNLCLKGPAIKIFKKKFKKIENKNLNRSLNQSKLLITGTSWPSRFETKAIREALKKKIKVITFLDHWTNYKLRFYLNNKLIFPHEIWVTDKMALKIAKKELPKINIKLKKNNYFEKKIKSLKKIKRKFKESNILYLCSPIIKNNYNLKKNYLFKYNEKSLLNYFFKNIQCLKFNYKNIIIRLHPSEKLKKYLWIKKKFGKKVIISKNKKLENDIASSKYIFGFNSNAMVLSALVGKKVFNISPLGKKANILPFKNILDFSKIVKRYDDKKN